MQHNTQCNTHSATTQYTYVVHTTQYSVQHNAIHIVHTTQYSVQHNAIHIVHTTQYSVQHNAIHIVHTTQYSVQHNAIHIVHTTQYSVQHNAIHIVQHNTIHSATQASHACAVQKRSRVKRQHFIEDFSALGWPSTEYKDCDMIQGL